MKKKDITDRKRHLLQALRGGRTESDPIELSGVQVKLRIVSSGEKDDCRMEATAALRKMQIEPQDRDGWLAGDTLYRVMARALIDPECGEPIGDYNQIRSHISTPNLDYLMQEYRRLESMVAPKSETDLDALYEEVKRYVGESEGDRADFLRTLDYYTLLSFARSMASRLPS